MGQTAIITCTCGDFDYIDEWIQYHHNLGVNLFLIAYNGPSEKFRDLRRYDYVRYIDFSYNETNLETFKYKPFTYVDEAHIDDIRNKGRQLKMLNILLYYVKLFYPEITYVMSTDIDEFIDIQDKNYSNITEFLNCIFDKSHSSENILMQFYTDNNLIYKEDKPVVERFTEADAGEISQYWWCSKPIIYMKHDDVQKMNFEIVNPHVCTNVEYGFYFDTNKLLLKHYFTKTIEEWISKLNPDYDLFYFERFRGRIFEGFFNEAKINKMTDEKIKAIPGLLKKYNIDYNIDEEQNEFFKQKYHEING